MRTKQEDLIECFLQQRLLASATQDYTQVVCPGLGADISSGTPVLGPAAGMQIR
jgi:hypothetical protein